MVRFDIGRTRKEKTKKQLQRELDDLRATDKAPLVEGLKKENALLQERVTELEERYKVMEETLREHQASCRRIIPDEKAPAKFIGEPVWKVVEWKVAELKRLLKTAADDRQNEALSWVEEARELLREE